MQGEVVWLGHRIATSTVWQILYEAGLDPAPRRSGPTWGQFLTAQAQVVLAVDFLHVDTVFLRRLYALIAVAHGSRRDIYSSDRTPERSVDYTGRSQPADETSSPRYQPDVSAPRP